MQKPPSTASELQEHKLFKISAEIDLDLYREFKATCASQGLKMKKEVEKALASHLIALRNSNTSK